MSRLEATEFLLRRHGATTETRLDHSDLRMIYEFMLQHRWTGSVAECQAYIDALKRGELSSGCAENDFDEPCRSRRAA